MTSFSCVSLINALTSSCLTHDTRLGGVHIRRCDLGFGQGPQIYLANFIYNRSRNVKTPYEVWFEKPPNAYDFKRFQNEVFLWTDHQTAKTSPRPMKEIFVGYNTEPKGYRLWLCQEKKSTDIKFPEASTVQSAEYLVNDFAS